MNIVRQRTGTDSAYKQNLYGSGIGIAVLDSGIYPHPDFMNHGSRITAFRDFVTIARHLMMTMDTVRILPELSLAAAIYLKGNIWAWLPGPI